MKNAPNRSTSLKPDELNVVYAISRVVAEKLDIDEALSEIIRLARPVFIFDKVVLYLENHEIEDLEPIFARAIGRGKSSEADISWGINAAHHAFSTGKIFLSEAPPNNKLDRLEQGFFLGQPMLVNDKIIGALVFVRFGGPTFSEEHINLAEYIALHITQVLEHKRLIEHVDQLEARVSAVIRRASISDAEVHESSLQIGDLTINLALAEVRKAGQQVALSSTEYRLLLLLARNLGQVLTSEKLLIGVWGKEYAAEKEILWVSISRLRQKIERDPKRPKLILTRSGEGYMMPQGAKRKIASNKP